MDSRPSGIFDSGVLRRDVVDHRTIGSPSFDQKRRHGTSITPTIRNPRSITASRLAVQSRIEEAKIKMLDEADSVKEGLFRGEEAKIVGRKREGLIGREGSTIVPMFEYDGYATGRVGENVQDAYRE